MTGKVKWFDEKKGFGFITPDDGSADVFAHYSEIAHTGFRTLHQGDHVRYRPELDSKGLRAKSICLLTRTAPFNPQPQHHRHD